MKDKQRKISLSNLPTAGSSTRKIIMQRLCIFPGYLEDIIERGLPFFSEEELKEIEKKYKDTGITRNDILEEAYKKGWLLKPNTIKSYIQKGLLPRALKRLKTDKGMISVYPPEVIRHLNFIRYFLFSGSKMVEALSILMEDAYINDMDRLMEKSVEIDNSGMDGNDCIHSLYIGISRLEKGIEWTEESVEKAFLIDTPRRKQYLQSISNLEEKVKEIRTAIEKFEDELKNSTTPLGIEALFSSDVDKKGV